MFSPDRGEDFCSTGNILGCTSRNKAMGNTKYFSFFDFYHLDLFRISYLEFQIL